MPLRNCDTAYRLISLDVARLYAFSTPTAVLLDFRLSLQWRTCELLQSQPGGREALAVNPGSPGELVSQFRGF